MQEVWGVGHEGECKRGRCPASTHTLDFPHASSVPRHAMSVQPTLRNVSTIRYLSTRTSASRWSLTAPASTASW